MIQRHYELLLAAYARPAAMFDFGIRDVTRPVWTAFRIEFRDGSVRFERAC